MTACYSNLEALNNDADIAFERRIVVTDRRQSCVPGTRYLARSWPAHVVSPTSLVRPLVAHTTYVCVARRSEEHTSELQSPCNLVCRLLLEKKKKTKNHINRR